MNNIEQVINAQIEANKGALKWSKRFLKGHELDESRNQFISNRIQLKHIQYASGMNPAAIVFGESQVGKSYLVDNLLASSKGPLRIYDGHGNSRSFKDEINPFGGGKESTSLASRFTTKKQWIDNNFPIKVMLLKPIDVVLTICDTFFNDVIKNHGFPELEEINTFIEQLVNQYKGKPEIQNFITEDEIFEMREYLKPDKMDILKYGESFRTNLKQAHFFEHIAFIISAVDVKDWKKVFGFLWNNNPVLNDVFERLIGTYQELGFNSEVYIKMDAVLREGGTILDVDRLFELFGISELSNGDKVKIATQPDMEVLTTLGQAPVTVKKSAFCALAAELILKVDDDLQTEKTFLKELDILDFPGARNRLELDGSKLSNDNACQMLIRGKVAYLFNKYSQQYLISNLLFCHHQIKSEVNTLPSLLERWIYDMVGDTAEKRAEYMQTTDVEPLFLIGTKFNMDMEQIPADFSESETTRQEALMKRWETRFTSLENLIGTQTSWFNQWKMGEPFKNLYLLRDYEYSWKDGLFTGYMSLDENGIRKLNLDENGKPVGERDFGVSQFGKGYEEHFLKLKESFLNYYFVKSHFKSPEKSWEEVATMNHDGSDWIIENLTTFSKNVSKLRVKKFEDMLHDLLKNLCQKLKSFYHDDNSDLELHHALEDAGRINMMMDILFGKDKYFFSEFINDMLVQEDDLHDVVLDTINSVTVLDKTTIDILFAIRERAKIDSSLDEEEARLRLRETYSFNSDVELDDDLASHGLTVNDIINPPEVKNFARIIVDAIEKYWFDEVLTVEHLNDFIKRGVSEKALNLLIANMTVLYKEKLHVTDLMTQQIHPYVTDLGHIDDMADMLADICAEMINRFINTAGTYYFHNEFWKDLNDTVAHNGFDLNVQVIDHTNMKFDQDKIREELSTVFDVFDNADSVLNAPAIDPSKLEYFSNYHAYKQWTEMLKVSFLATCGIPKYDIVANNELRAVIVNGILNSEDLRPVIDDSMGLSSMKSLKV